MNWLLLRGLAREQRHWGRFPETLAAKLAVGPEGGSVHCLDLPGMGTEHARPGRGTIDAIVEDLRRRWRPLAEQHLGPWCVAGISLGGMAALRWVGDHPSDFSSLVVVNSSAGDLSPPWHRMTPRVLPEVMRALLERDPVARERRILSATTRMKNDLDSIAFAWARFQIDRPITRFAVLLQLLAAMRFRAPRSLAVPTLIIAGLRDPFTNPSCARRLAERFEARLETHPSAGHDLSTDDPDWLAERIAAFPPSVRG